MSVAWTVAWMRRAQQLFAEHRMELIELDRQIGDGDHGENLDRGFTAVAAQLDSAPADSASVLKTVASTLMSTVGGAAGPLYGTGFIRASRVIPDELTGPAVAQLLAAFLEGVQARGKAVAGEKTMVDAWIPAVAAAQQAAAAGSGPAQVLTAAAAAAQAGSDATIAMIATKGRASYLGERSAGHRDPGSRSSALLLQAAAETAKEYL